MMSILSAWSAAIELPQLTSTVSILVPSVSAIALPIEMPRPDDHSPVFGSLENQGGAWVTPTRKVPRFFTSSSVPSARSANRSEEHTSELQSHHDLVCRLLLE